MKILDRTIGLIVIKTTVMVSMVIIAIQSFLALVQQFSLVGTHGYTVRQALLFVPMQLPIAFYQLFPMAGFLGALIALSRLSASSELIVMRVSGVSIVRIGWSVIKASILMIVFITVLGEVIGPSLQVKSEQMEQAIISPDSKDVLLKSIWLHQGDTFTHIGKLENANTMTDITRYHFNNNDQMTQVTSAKMGQLQDGQWLLSNLKHTYFLEDRVKTAKVAEATWNFAFQPRLQVRMKAAAGEQSLPELFHTIQYRQSIGLSTKRFLFSFWQRILQPVTTLVLIGLAVPFVFGSFRDSSMGMRIMTGVLIGFAFYMMNQLFGPITLVYQFPPLLAAVLPTMIFFIIAAVLLSKTR